MLRRVVIYARFE